MKRYDNPAVLKRLDVRLFEASPEDSGWEVFSLDYNVTNPLNVVITTAAMDKYVPYSDSLNVFMFVLV